MIPRPLVEQALREMEEAARQNEALASIHDTPRDERRHLRTAAATWEACARKLRAVLGRDPILDTEARS